MNILYLSYDGMTDPLGQSQVLPYLVGLSKKGYQITLLSFEKNDRYLSFQENIEQITNSSGIKWVPLSYTSTPPVISTIYDIFRMNRKIRKLHKSESFQLVHCRSYITALAGLRLKRKYGIKFVFDMRGFWPDERVDGKVWNLKNPLFKWVYNYFKKKEKEFLLESDCVVSLTESGKQDILNRETDYQNIQVQVIPCCADLDLFKREDILPNSIKKFRDMLRIWENDYVLTYLGSIGTWYMLDEMLDFFKELLIKKPNAKFLFISGDDPSHIILKAAEKRIPADRIIVKPAQRKDVPAMLMMSSISIFFILPVYSKKASSPTKMGEIMGMGIPIICNSNVGDCDLIMKDTHSGLLVDELNPLGYQKALLHLGELENLDPMQIRNGAIKYFSLTDGIEKYAAVYDSLLN